MFFTEGEFAQPKHVYGGREPIIALISDDCQSTALFRSKQFQNLVIRHRHVGQFKSGGALGISLFTCCQNYTAQGGLPRAIRGNVTSMVIFSIKDKKQLAQIASECAGEIDEATFNQVYESAIGDNSDYPFLYVDFNRKKEQPSAFRRRFNEYLII